MRLGLTAGWGMLICCVCVGEAQGALPIDRPSPPPYCADGKCYPKTETWGFYQGRWRSWPGVNTSPLPSTVEPTPAQLLGPDLKPYETPSPENEDRRAPPPTQPKEPPAAPTPVLPPEGAGLGPTAPAGPGLEPTLPPGPGAAPATPRVIMPIPSGNLPGGAGAEGGDYPPPLPFGTQPASPLQSPSLPFSSPTPNALPSNVPGDLPIPPDRAELRRESLPSAANNDPPPPLPGALGSWFPGDR
jgi:hypothetical protein